MINWGIIGLGSMANRFASSISEVKNTKLLGIASTSFLRLKRFGDKYNIEKKYSPSKQQLRIYLFNRK